GRRLTIRQLRQFQWTQPRGRSAAQALRPRGSGFRGPVRSGGEGRKRQAWEGDLFSPFIRFHLRSVSVRLSKPSPVQNTRWLKLNTFSYLQEDSHVNWRSSFPPYTAIPPRATLEVHMVFVLDNYDSFTYNLVQYLGELGAKIEVRRND